MPIKPGVCTRCHGTGKEPDDLTRGQKMRDRRMEAGLSMRELAARMGLKSPGFICQLEKGTRHWTKRWIDKYEAALLPRGKHKEG